MSPSSVDNRPYIKLLEDFLLQLKAAIDEQSHQGLTTLAGTDGWERYILELNSFYYHDFHDRFIPQYRDQIDHDIRSIYNASQNTLVLKQELAANLKHWAELYNQVLHLQQTIQEQLSALQKQAPAQWGSDAQSVEMIYILKDLARHFASFLERQRNRQVILDDSRFVDGLKRFPEQRSVGAVISQWTPDGPKAQRELNQLLSSWQLVLKQLDKMPAKEAINRESVRSLLKELQKADLVWTDRKAPPIFRSWYKLNIQPIFQFHLWSLDLFGERNDRKRVIQSAVMLVDWLKSLIYIFEQTKGYFDKGWGDLVGSDLHYLTQFNPEQLSEKIVEATRTLQQLAGLVDSLSPATADYALHSQRAAAMISDSLSYWQKHSQNSGSVGSMLPGDTEWLVSQLKLAMSQILILDEREASHLTINQQFDFLRKTLSSWGQKVSELQDYLRLKLDPIALQRQYPNHTIEIRQVIVRQGAPFPAEFAFLLNQGAVTMAESDSNAGQVIHTEGDMFFINVDGYREQAIPQIILAAKES